MSLEAEDFGKAIPIPIANKYIKKYRDINDTAGELVRKFLESINQKEASNFFKTIQVNNAFVFEADLISRFFSEKSEKPEYIVVCIGGNIEAAKIGEATVVVTGCIVDANDENKLNIIKGLSNPVSEHPAKKAIVHFDENKPGNEKLSFLFI